jgi:hypothetical protein
VVNCVIQCAWKADAVLALCGYSVAIPDELVAQDADWVTNYGIGNKVVEGWIALELRLTKFLHETAMYQNWAERVRRRNGQSPATEWYIAHWGEKLESQINSWADTNIPPYAIEPAIHEDEDPSDPASQFLRNPQFRFLSFFHTEIHLLWYTNLLIISYVKYPEPGPIPPERFAVAIRFCQSLAALGNEHGTYGVKSLTFGLFYATLTFGELFSDGNSHYSEGLIP